MSALASSSRRLFASGSLHTTGRSVALRQRHLLVNTAPLLSQCSGQQIRGFNFAPGDWIRNAIRSRTRSLKEESEADREESKRKAIQSGDASLFDAVEQEVPSSSSSQPSLTKAKKIHDEHRFSTGTFKISPRKLNMLGRQIAGKPIDQAILQMQFSDKRAGGKIKSMLCLARDHAELKGIRRERMIVSQSWANKIMALARLEPKGRGRAGMRHHRYSKLHVLLKEGETHEEVLMRNRAKALRRAVSAGVVREDVPIRNPRPQWAW